MGTVHELTTLIDELFAVDVDSLDDVSLDAHVTEISRQRDRLAAAHAQFLARWDARKLWAQDGSRSAAARLARDTTSFTTTTRAELRRARRLMALPATAAAARRGQLSLDQVDVMTRAAQPWRREHMARDEQQLVELCRELSAADTKKILTYWGHRADAEVGRDPGPRDIANHLHVSETLDGNLVINGQLDPIGGAAFFNELKRLAEQIRQADAAAGIDRTPAQRRAAALIDMATRSAATPADGRQPGILLSVQLGDDSVRHLCELANGTVITPGELVPWLSTADLETILFDGPSTVISLSRQRTFTGALRRAIQVRDRHCQHPSGCEVPADECDVDHIVPYAAGGPTDQFNGRLECPTHNRRSDLHDHGAAPLPRRTVAHIDALRARVRWRIRHGDHGDVPAP